MTSKVVVDASALVPALLGPDEVGAAAAQALLGKDLAAPALLPFEVAHVLRRQEHRGAITPELAQIAVDALVALQWEPWPFEPLADRMWTLRGNLSAYDASYVALAEVLEIPLVTLDRRLARAPGIRCEVVVPS